jgi:hypothetical protein
MGFEVRAYRMWQLAAAYQVHVSTFRKWIKPHQDKIGKQISRMYTPKQVQIIIDCLGEPPDENN